MIRSALFPEPWVCEFFLDDCQVSRFPQHGISLVRWFAMTGTHQRIQGRGALWAPLLPLSFFFFFESCRQFSGENPYFEQILGPSPPPSEGQNFPGPLRPKSWILWVRCNAVTGTKQKTLYLWKLAVVSLFQSSQVLSSSRILFHSLAVLRYQGPQHLRGFTGRVGWTCKRRRDSSVNLSRGEINPSGLSFTLSTVLFLFRKWTTAGPILPQRKRKKERERERVSSVSWLLAKHCSNSSIEQDSHSMCMNTSPKRKKKK